ncbi:hypothetical protein [Pseudomonas sp. CGJS7]|uniref:hypothetical protein n=1 Tax=Pseudomonas sp. CGJS7 TaxID=3109348 RepID=UPI003008BA6B
MAKANGRVPNELPTRIPVEKFERQEIGSSSACFQHGSLHASRLQQPQPPDFIALAQADALRRDLDLINGATRSELGLRLASDATSRPKRKPILATSSAAPGSSEELRQEIDDVSIKHLTAIAASATLGLAACQQENAAAPPPPIETARVEQVAPVTISDMQAAASVFASERGRDWDAYGALSQVKWKDSVPQEFTAGRYSRSGTVLLQGFTIKDIPNGKPGSDYATTKRNEGESTLTVAGTLSGVDSVSIRKPLYSDNYLGVLNNQFKAARISTIADQCPAPEYEEGAGEGAFFEVSLADNRKIYVQASQKDGGKNTDGFTVFDLTRQRPSDAISELNCKAVE